MATIYKIYCRDSEITDCYVGSTEDYNKRCENHKKVCNNTNDPGYNYKVYTFIRANLGMDNFIIEAIIDCNVEDRYIEEQRYFELLKPTLNTQYPKRNRKEYRFDNKQKILEKDKIYRIDNKEKISEKRKIKIECECGSLVRKADIIKHNKTNKHQNYINSKL